MLTKSNSSACEDTRRPIGAADSIAMEALRLFALGPELAAWSTTHQRPVQELDEDTLHEAEAFLADQLEREGDLAVIQAALALWEATGGCDRDTFFVAALDAIDPSRFPRSLGAVERVRELLDGPVAERPEGFWPNFLLEQLASSAG